MRVGGFLHRTHEAEAKAPHRVLILSPFPTFGAAEDYALILAEGLLARGWRPTFAASDAVRLTLERRFRGGDLLSISQGQLKSPISLSSLIRSVRAEIVHVNHDFLPGMAAGVIRRRATVVTSHTPALQVRYSGRGQALVRWAAPRVDAWIALSSRNAALLAEQHSIAAGRIRVISPGLPSSRFPSPRAVDARGILGLPPHAFVVGTAGRIARQKRQDLLIRAAALASRQVPNLWVVVLGDGELRAETESLAEAILPGRVLFAGHRDDVPALLPAFDIFCLPSDFEGLPFALLEAMAMSRAIVATDVQGSGEAIADGVHGLLVPPGFPEPLAGAIVRLAGDPGQAHELGRRARERFLAQFTDGSMVERTIDLYRELLEARSPQ